MSRFMRWTGGLLVTTVLFKLYWESDFRMGQLEDRIQKATAFDEERRRDAKRIAEEQHAQLEHIKATAPRYKY